MQIQPISLNLGVSYPNFSNKNYVQPKKQSFSGDKIQFTGINDIIIKGAATTFNKDSELEKVFIQLMNEIKTDSKIIKFPDFIEIIKIFDQSGFRGVMNELWKANPTTQIMELVNKSEKDRLILATRNNKPIVELYNLGKHGFWNAITDSQEAPRDMRLCFGNNKTYMHFYLDKKGDCSLCQSIGDTTTYSAYYASTGNKKFETRHCESCAPETTYYNKDGTKAFFKNWFFGGPAIAPVY